MKETIQYANNYATAYQIEEHLRVCDADFFPPLSNRVDIAAYAKKIVQHAQRFEVWSEDRLIGLVAAYCNKPANEAAFITNVSISPNVRGFGLADRLLEATLNHIITLGYSRVELRIKSHNLPALRLYTRNNFATVERNGEEWIMCRHLKGALRGRK